MSHLPVEAFSEIVEFLQFTSSLRLVHTSRTMASIIMCRLKQYPEEMLQQWTEYERVKGIYLGAHRGNRLIQALFSSLDNAWGGRWGQGVNWTNQASLQFNVNYRTIAGLANNLAGALQYDAGNVQEMLQTRLKDSDGFPSFLRGPNNEYRLYRDHSATPVQLIDPNSTEEN